MSSQLLQVLESHPYTAEGRADASVALRKHAKTLVARKAAKRFCVGTQVVRDATTRGNVILVCLYEREEDPAEETLEEQAS